MENHEEFVLVDAVLLEGAGFQAVLGETEGLVEADGRDVGADDRQVELLDARAGGIDDRLDQEAGGAGAAMRGSDVQGAEPAFVGVLGARVLAEGGDANQMGVVKDAEDLGVVQPNGVFFNRRGLFGFVGAAEGVGGEAESFEADFTEGIEVGGSELADGERHNL